MTPLKSSSRRIAAIGDLVVEAFDRAARLTADPQEVARLATRAVSRTLGRARRLRAARLLGSGTRILPLLLLAVALGPSLARADDRGEDPPDRVARPSFLRGTVSLQPAGEGEWTAAISNRPLTTGDRLWTEAGGRAELSLGSTTIRLDGETDAAFLDLDDHALQLQLSQGIVTVTVRRLHADEVVEVDTPNQAFSILRPGRYRLEVRPDADETLITVRTGEGEATGGGRTFALGAGQVAHLTGLDPPDATLLRAGPLDELERWSEARDRRSWESPSARYVSREVVGYEDLDDHGRWSAEPAFGHVWYPAGVDSGWAPYHDGHWAWISPWGYTWVDDAAWGYAPFHYGRWVAIRGRWAWVPGPPAVEAVYAPALVVFIGGPGFALSLSAGGDGRDEVAWVPLGPREVYLPACRASRAYVERINVSNTTVTTTTITRVYADRPDHGYRVGDARYANLAAPGGVTVVPRQAFAEARPVARAAVAVDRRRLAAAPVAPAAAVVPTRGSVFGAPADRVEGARRPPPVAARTVVAKKAPPPPAVPFERQRAALEATPGRPLPRRDVQAARPLEATAPRPVVRLAPPGRPSALRTSLEPAAAPTPAKVAAPAVAPAPADRHAAEKTQRAGPARGRAKDADEKDGDEHDVDEKGQRARPPGAGGEATRR